MSNSSENDLQKTMQMDQLRSQMSGADEAAVNRANETLDGLEQAAAAVGGEEDETSIQDYMAALLQRANGHSEQPEGSRPKPAPAPKPKIETPAPSDDATPSQDDDVPDEKPARIQKAAPEQRSDLSSMRELANANARSALDKYSGSQLVRSLYGKLAVAVTAMGLSIFVSMASNEVFSALFIVSAASFAVAILWTVRFMTQSSALQLVVGGETPGGSELEKPGFTPEVTVNPLTSDDI